jgi:hypothetical protein
MDVGIMMVLSFLMGMEHFGIKEQLKEHTSLVLII